MRSSTTPITIITGFLGAGKTTLLNNILHNTHQQIAVLVNDFGIVNIDAQLIVGVEDNAISLTNGCICCTIRDDLIAGLSYLLERPAPPEHLIIETSGVSDPQSILLTLKLPEIIDRTRIDSVIAVVDADQMLGLSDDYMELALCQIMTGDIILLNKIDIVKPESVAQIKQTIKTLIPNSRTIETSYCDVAMDIIFDGKHMDKESATFHHHHSETDTWSWETPHRLSLDALQQLVVNLPTTIYRAKGILYLAGREEMQGIFQLVGKRASLSFKEYRGNRIPESQILVIGKDLDIDDLERRFEKCIRQS